LQFYIHLLLKLTGVENRMIQCQTFLSKKRSII